MATSVTLVVPGLGAPDSAEQHRNGQWRRLLARGSLAAAPRDAEALGWWLATGLSALPPVAAICRLADGGRLDNRYWLRADPCSMLAGPESVYLQSQVTLQPDEARALADSLASVFADTGVAFEPRTAQRWYLGFDHALDVHCESPRAAASMAMVDALPAGPDAATLIRLMTEVQMVLHEHPVKLAQERAGQSPVNAIWCWGGSVAQPSIGQIAAPAATLFADNSFIELAWRALGGKTRRLPDVPMVVCEVQGNVILALPGDPATTIDDWLAAMLGMLKDGDMTTLHVVSEGARVSLTRRALRRFWQRHGDWPWQT